jgi:hypothetical protein
MTPQVFPYRAKIVTKPRIGTTRLKSKAASKVRGVAKVLSRKV